MESPKVQKVSKLAKYQWSWFPSLIFFHPEKTVSASVCFGAFFDFSSSLNSRFPWVQASRKTKENPPETNSKAVCTWK